ncbi:MAG: HAMP domain-containing histidine kinase [Actinobacteria bacterium]|nr:HAMP domain-containing histidine kinase [Actinomycetota bacterium]MCA1721643.1 HAMP domain-containing histidine kinase [Actinomycetota bacterium]
MIGAHDLVVVLALAAGAGLAVTAGGLYVLRRMRGRSLRLLVVLVAIISVGAVAAGSLAVASAMFLSPHDLRVLLAVTAVAAGLATVTAVVLGRDVAAGSRALSAAAAGLSDGTYRSPAVRLPAELAALDRALSEMSIRLAGAWERERTMEASRRELVSWMSHDLRTPLAGIRAMAEALEDAVVDDPVTIDRYHRKIRSEADRLAQMVDDLFELSRINASALHLDLQVLELDDLLSDAVASVQPVADRAGVTVHAEAPVDVPAVRGSVPELARVMNNLLANAVRHTPAGGSIRVCARRDGTTAVVTVDDECGGIPADDLPRLFDVSFRGTAARTPDGDGGAGLGLAIVRGFVEAHRGTVAIENRGSGCRAEVRLEAAGPSEEAEAVPQSSPEPVQLPHV